MAPRFLGKVHAPIYMYTQHVLWSQTLYPANPLPIDTATQEFCDGCGTAPAGEGGAILGEASACCHGLLRDAVSSLRNRRAARCRSHRTRPRGPGMRCDHPDGPLVSSRAALLAIAQLLPRAWRYVIVDGRGVLLTLAPSFPSYRTQR